MLRMTQIPKGTANQELIVYIERSPIGLYMLYFNSSADDQKQLFGDACMNYMNFIRTRFGAVEFKHIFIDMDAKRSHWFNQ